MLGCHELASYHRLGGKEPRERGAVGAREVPPACPVGRDGKAALVDKAVVVTTQQHEVIEFGFAPVGPVDDVVSVDEALPGASREAAAAIAPAEPPDNGWGDGAGAAADVEHIPRRVLGHDDEAGVAGETPRRRFSDGRAAIWA